MTKKKNVILFGLSANPPTGMGGHAGIVSWAAHTTIAGFGPVDEVWVLPVFHHAFCEKKEMGVSFEHRFAMAQLGLIPEGLEDRVFVRDDERRLSEERSDSDDLKIGTIDVVERLRAKHPDHHFALLLGGDTYQDLKAGLWKESERLLSMLPVVVVPRSGYHTENLTDEDAYVSAPVLTDISSTAARSSTDPDFLRQVLHPRVLSYIRENGLYSWGEDRSV